MNAIRPGRPSATAAAVFGVLVVLAAEAGTAQPAVQAPGRPEPDVHAVRTPVPRTSLGRPSLEGVWNFSTVTPLQRPPELAGRAYLTDDEVAEYEKQVVTSRSLDRRDGSGTADVGRAYNDFWADWGTRVVATKRTSLVVDPADGRLPPLTPEAEAREAARVAASRRPAAGPEDRSISERCLLGFNAGPPMITGPYNNHVQLFQTAGSVVVLNEMNHAARIIPLDGRPHVSGRIRQWAGDSRGRWEGDTLVVETANFGPAGTGNITLPVPTSGSMRLTERFTRLDDDILLYRFTVDDPFTWTRPWTAEIPMRRTDDLLYEFACHEGNYAMIGILSAARAEEKGSAATK